MTKAIIGGKGHKRRKTVKRKVKRKSASDKPLSALKKKALVRLAKKAHISDPESRKKKSLVRLLSLRKSKRRKRKAPKRALKRKAPKRKRKRKVVKRALKRKAPKRRKTKRRVARR